MKCSLVVVVVASVIAGLVKFGTTVGDPSVTVLADEPGIYEVSCLLAIGLQPCPTISTDNYQVTVGTGVALKAHISDYLGTAAITGEEIFQDCFLQTMPAPFAQCDSGSGHWSNVISVHVTLDINGDVVVNYGTVSTPQTIGFRFRYFGQGSGIANGVNAPMDVTWVQQ